MLLDSADFLAESLRWAGGVLDRPATVQRPEVDRGRRLGRRPGQGPGGGRRPAARRAPAPYRALELIELARTADFATGTAAEDEALADLIMSDELRSGLYAFDLVNKRAKRPAGAPDKALARPVTKVGVVGAGLMAGQLALLFARRLEVPVVLTDLDQDRLDKGVGYVHGEIDALLAKGRINQDKANRLKALVTGSLTKDAFADADFVIEAVFEELSVKKAVFAELEQHVSPEAILATNTSSLSVTEMAAELAHPERVVGFHFFNPVAVLPLLEVVRGAKTDDAALATAFAVAKTLKKSAVLVSDAPAFVVNRLLTRFLGEVHRGGGRGHPDRGGRPGAGPAGPADVAVRAAGPGRARRWRCTSPRPCTRPSADRFGVSENLRRLVEAEKPGVYLWDSGSPEVDPEVAELFVLGDRPSTEEQVRDRALAALAQEIDLMLADGVVAEPQDIDLCLLLGSGWPFHLGGITPYLDRQGVSERVRGRRFLPPGWPASHRRARGQGSTVQQLSTRALE